MQMSHNLAYSDFDLRINISFHPTHICIYAHAYTRENPYNSFLALIANKSALNQKINIISLKTHSAREARLDGLLTFCYHHSSSIPLQRRQRGASSHRALRIVTANFYAHRSVSRQMHALALVAKVNFP